MSDRHLDGFASYDGAYVLGALTPAERADYEEHLAGCPDCRRAVDSFAGLPGLLSRVPRTELTTESAAPPPELLPRLLESAARRRRRARWVVTAGAAAAAAVCLVLALLLATAPRAGSPAPSPTRPMAAVVSAPVTATVALTARPWGTDVALHCRYHGGAGYPGGYVLVVVDLAGRVDRLSSWDAVPGVTASLHGTTSVHTDQIRAVQVRTTGGTPILTISP